MHAERKKPNTFSHLILHNILATLYTNYVDLMAMQINNIFMRWQLAHQYFYY